MADSLIKQEDQTIWYENDELIKQYLESSDKLSKIKAFRPGEKLSLLNLIKNAMADPTE
jgi:hypothetical protein